MFTIEINREVELNNVVEINFQEVYDYIIDKGNEHNTSFREYVYDFEGIIFGFMEVYPQYKDCVDVLDSYRYTVTVENEEVADQLVDYFEFRFHNVLQRLEDSVESYEEDDIDYCDEEEEYIIEY